MGVAAEEGVDVPRAVAVAGGVRHAPVAATDLRRAMVAAGDLPLAMVVVADVPRAAVAVPIVPRGVAHSCRTCPGGGNLVVHAHPLSLRCTPGPLSSSHGPGTQTTRDGHEVAAPARVQRDPIPSSAVTTADPPPARG